jgi:PKHD-type hydroxylase
MGTAGQVGGMGANGTVKIERRKAVGTSVAKTDDSFNWVLQRTLDFARKKNLEYWQYNVPDYNSELIEDMHFVMYNGSLGGFYDWHSDTAVAGPRSLRKISAVLILSNPLNYTGGEFLLKPEDKEIALPRDQGSLILFPSFVLHKVDPVTSGYRHSIVMQIGGYN